MSDTIDPDDVERTRFVDSALDELDTLANEPVDAAAFIIIRDGGVTVDWHINEYRTSLCNLALQGSLAMLIRLLQDSASPSKDDHET